MPPTPSKPVAVVANSISFALDWIRMNFEVREIRGAQGMVILKDGRTLKVITKLGEARGYEFAEYILCPDYMDVLTEVRERVR